jgi:hypothetical protein
LSHPPSRPPLASGQSWELASISCLPSHCLTSWEDPPHAGRASTVKGLCGLSHGVPHLLPLGAVALCANHRLVTVRRLRPGQGSRNSFKGQSPKRSKVSHAPSGAPLKAATRSSCVVQVVPSLPSHSQPTSKAARDGSDGSMGMEGDVLLEIQISPVLLSAPGTR